MTEPAVEDRFASAREARKALERVNGPSHRWPAIAATTVAAMAFVGWLPKAHVRPGPVQVEPPPAASGTLRVSNHQAGVRVSTDGKLLGPISEGPFAMTAGRHRLLIAGSERYLPWTEDVIVPESGVLDLGAIALKVVVGRATIDASTPGAHIFVVQRPLRRELPMVPISIDIDTSMDWALEAHMPGYLDYWRSIEFSDGNAERSYAVYLAPVGSPPLEIVSRTQVEPHPSDPAGPAFVSFEHNDIFWCTLDGMPLKPPPSSDVPVIPGAHSVVFYQFDGRSSAPVPLHVDANERVVVHVEIAPRIMPAIEAPDRTLMNQP